MFIFLVQIFQTNYKKLQKKKASKVRDTAIRSEVAKAYKAIKCFFVGRVYFDPDHIQPPMPEFANKDYYPEHKDTLKAGWYEKGPVSNLEMFSRVAAR